MIRCEVEESVPIPTQKGTHHDVYERAHAACAAANILLDHGYKEPELDPGDVAYDIKVKMREVVKGNPADFSIESSSATGAMMVYSILDEYIKPVVRESQELRNYVTNKLILESDSSDPRVRIKALELIGKIKGVDLFSEHSEVTVHNKTDSELVSVLKSKLAKLANVSDAVVVSESKTKQ